jgi:uncharacterized membrane protein YfcA
VGEFEDDALLKTFGASGMAYGITASSFLLAAGMPPAMASGATHLAEVFTTGISGVSHLRWRFRVG